MEQQNTQNTTRGGKKMKVLGICGSPRDGNTVWVMRKILVKHKVDIEPEVIFLKDLKIELCDGCLTCEDTGECVKNDDLQPIYKKLVKCDKLVIGTPVYFDSIPALLKNFIDRLNPHCVNESLKNKDVYLIVIGQLPDEEGKESRRKVIEYFKGLCEIFSMNFQKAWGLSAREPQDASKLENIIQLCDEIKGEIYGKT
jgi:multimeric flavodoxin WrbA